MPNLSPPAADPLERFQRDVCWNRQMADALRRRQNGLCTVCGTTLGQRHLVIHHLDHAHECTWSATITVTRCRQTRRIPDCAGCQADDPDRFACCRRRLQLLHRPCHAAYHRGEMGVQPMV